MPLSGVEVRRWLFRPAVMAVSRFTFLVGRGGGVQFLDTSLKRLAERDYVPRHPVDVLEPITLLFQVSLMMQRDDLVLVVRVWVP